jgi:HK97 family phage portal protein
VSADQAMRLAAVYSCVNILAKTFAVLPFCLFVPRTDGGRDPATDHWLYKLISKRPNQFQNPFEWRQMLMGHLALRGNAYNRIYTNAAGQITDLIPQHPDRIRVDVLPTGEYRYLIRQPNGEDAIVPRGEVWHMRWLSSDGIVGISPIECARETVGIGLAAQDYGARFFANDGSPPGWIEHPGQFKDKTARDNFRESWKTAQSGRNRGKTAVLEGGMKYHDLQIKNSDAQFLETRKFSVTDIARIFGVPPHLVGDLDRATFANIEQQSLEFVIYTMTPITEAWEASIEYSLLPDDEDLDPEFDLARLLRGDQAARATFYTKLFGLGALSTNEIRIKEGDNPVVGGNNRFVPVNLRLLEEDMTDPPPPGGGVPGEPSNSDEPPADRANALASAAAERVARREVAVVTRAFKLGPEALAEAYADHALFVAQALSVPAAAAEAYCAQMLQWIAGNTQLTDFETIARCQLERLALKGTA